MKILDYTNTNLIVNYLIKIELILERIKNLTIPKTYIKDFQEDQAAEDIHALSRLIDHPIGLDQARKIYLGNIQPSNRSNFLIFTNYRNTIEFAKNYDRNNFMHPSNELILHINSIIGNKIDEDWNAGRLRTFTDKPNPIYDSWIKLRDYYPTVIFEDHFGDIMETLFEGSKSSIPGFIKLAILTYEIIDKAPFTVANQVTTVALLETLSGDLKKNPNHTIPFARILNYIKKDLENAFKLSKQHRDTTSFIEAFLYSCSVHLLDLEVKYKELYDSKVIKHGKINEKFNKRQLKTLDYLEYSNKITRDELAKMMGVSFMTAYRDLQGLLKEKFISQHGSGRSTYYALAGEEMAEETEDEKLEVFGSLE